MRERRVRALPVIGVVVTALWATALAPPAPAQPAPAQQRHVVVVGDSVVLGAEGPMVAGFAGRGWGVTFDAAVSRSTDQAVGAVASHRPLLTDSLVLSFGANDAGNTTVFRQRVEMVLDTVADVPHVYWLSIREVRDDYAPANQVLRDAAAARPNVTVLDWHAASSGHSGLTASDGLYLSGSGAAVITDLVLRAVVDGTAAPPPPAPPVAVTEPPPPPPPPTTMVVVPTTPGPATSTTTASTTTGPPATAPRATASPRRADAVEEVADGGVPLGLDGLRALGLTLGAAVLVVLVVLGFGGVILGGWAFVAAGRAGRSHAGEGGTTRARR